MRFATVRVSPIASPEFWLTEVYYADGNTKHLIDSSPKFEVELAGTKVFVKAESEANGFAATGTKDNVFLGNYDLADFSENFAKIVKDVAGVGAYSINHYVGSLLVSPYDDDLCGFFYRPNDASNDLKFIFVDSLGNIDYVIDCDESTRGSPYDSSDEARIKFQTNGDVWVIGPSNSEDSVIPVSVRRFEFFTNVYTLTRSSSYLSQGIFKTIGERVDVPDGGTRPDVGTFVWRFAADVDPTDNSLVMFGYECFEVSDTTGNPNYYYPCLVRVTTAGVITSTRLYDSDFVPEGHNNWEINAWDMVIDTDGDIYIWWEHNELVSPFRGGAFLTKLNSSFVIQWTMKSENFAPSSPGQSKLVFSPDGANLYLTWGSSTGFTLDIYIFNKETGEHIDHGVLSGLNENDWTRQLLFPKISTNSSRIIVGGVLNDNYYRNGFTLINTNQYDFERGGMFYNFRILYDRWNTNVGDNQLRNRDTLRWSSDSTIITGTSYVGEYSYGGGLGASVTVTDDSAAITSANVTETPTNTNVQR